MEIEIVTALTAIIAVVVSLITATSAAKQSAFESLKKVVDELQEQLDEERKRRQKVERWARLLVKQLQENGIVPAPFESDPKIPNPTKVT